MKTLLTAFLVVATLSSPALAQSLRYAGKGTIAEYGEVDVLVTQDVKTLPKGAIHFSFGIDYASEDNTSRTCVSQYTFNIGEESITLSQNEDTLAFATKDLAPSVVSKTEGKYLTECYDEKKIHGENPEITLRDNAQLYRWGSRYKFDIAGNELSLSLVEFEKKEFGHGYSKHIYYDKRYENYVMDAFADTAPAKARVVWLVRDKKGPPKSGHFNIELQK